MAYRVTFALDTPKEVRAETLNALLGLLTKIDANYLRTHRVPSLGKLFKAGKVREFRAPSGQEEWQDVPTAIESGLADSEDLVCWRASESMLSGRPAMPVVSGGMPEEFGNGRFTFALGLFSAEAEREMSRKALGLMLDALYAIDLLYLKRRPNTPRLYDTNVLYMEEPTGQEEWQDIGTALKMGIADCEDLACWLAAELTLQGIPARPIYQEHRRPNGSYLYHIVTKLADGRILDPSKRQGMR